MIRVLICDDHAIMRKGLAMVLSREKDIEVVGEASDCADLLQRLGTTDCDVVLVDVEMPGRDGIEAIARLRAERPRIAALVLSAHPETRYAVRALRAGAAGYLNKADAPKTLIEAVRSVAKGQRFITPEVAQVLAQTVSCAAPQALHLQLSNREFQVLRMIARGSQLSEIAGALSLAPKTVSVYRARLLKKLGLNGNVEIAHYAVRHGLHDSVSA